MCVRISLLIKQQVSCFCFTYSIYNDNLLLFWLSDQICSSLDTFTTIVIKTTATTVTIITPITPVTISPSSTINTIETLCPTGWIGGIMVGMMSSAFVILIPVMVMGMVRKKMRAKEDNTIKNNNRYVQNCALYVYNLQKQVIWQKIIWT